MKQIVYKIIETRLDGTLVSVYSYRKSRKVYRPGVTHKAAKWLADKGYYITAFKSRKVATLFRPPGLFPRMQLWKCEATGIIPRRKLPPICQLGPLSDGKFISAPSVDIWPPGTVMCKTIKLLERVK